MMRNGKQTGNGVLASASVALPLALLMALVGGAWATAQDAATRVGEVACVAVEDLDPETSADQRYAVVEACLADARERVDRLRAGSVNPDDAYDVFDAELVAQRRILELSLVQLAEDGEMRTLLNQLEIAIDDQKDRIARLPASVPQATRDDLTARLSEARVRRDALAGDLSKLRKEVAEVALGLSENRKTIVVYLAQDTIDLALKDMERAFSGIGRIASDARDAIARAKSGPVD